jgi:uncharacterized membrane protein YjgN (DUF898 family)
MNREKAPSAIQFEGSWREFAPIAFSNLLLTIATLGVYSFWARTRTRRYLWSRTSFIDDHLSWTGTGRELFIGFAIAVAILAIPAVILNIVVQALGYTHQETLAVLLFLGAYAFLLFLFGVGRFRALRYRLSRSFWHGIRGGGTDQGLAYGVNYMWKMILGYCTLGVMFPWAMATLWNERFDAMSFGSIRFESRGRYQPVFARFLLCYAAVVFAAISLIPIFFVLLPEILAINPEDIPGYVFVIRVVVSVIIALVFGIGSLFYYSAYYREMVGNLRFGDLEFAFTARTMDWFKLTAGNVLLTVFTLGIGSVFVGYRNWVFFVRHVEAYGTLPLDDFDQSQTRGSGLSEGLLDALDVGAF